MNRLRTRLRTHTAQRREGDREQALGPELAKANAPSFTARNEQERAEKLAHLLWALSKLQRIVHMRPGELRSNEEVARELGLSPRSVRRQFATAVAELRRILRD